MSEDLTMDMKSAPALRANQFASKQGGSNAGSKNKVQDASAISRGRGPRGRREGSVPQQSAPKSDQFRQRGKAYDKRPRPRGQYNEGGKEDPQVEDHGAEYDSVLSGRKKVNLNHLLNFHYGPKEGMGGFSPPGNKNWQHAPQRHRFNKEQFLQANCQFVVRSGADYSRYFNDPDTLVQWDAIEQIRIQTSEMLSCPICLYQPTAARITKCGHIFCWPCILHYLALGEKSWRKCPICYESIYKDDLKSVIALYHEDLKVGDIVTLKLMKREKGSLIVLPVESESESRGGKDDNQQCKLLMASPIEILAILQQETDELKERLRDEQGDPEICFTEQAVDLLEQRKVFVSSNVAPAETVAGDVENCNYLDSGVAKESDNGSELAECCGGGEEEKKEVKKTFYFYQAEDGQHVYLHALNVHMMEHTHGGLERCPASIRGRIVEKEAGSMSPELRQRLRYLQHLPLTCQFEVVELELRPPAVSKPTLHQFKEQVEARKKKRQRRARDELKLAKRISDEENIRWGKFPLPNAPIESLQHFPECGQAVTAEPDMSVEEAMQELSVDPGNSYAGPSFSKMLQEGKSHTPTAWAPKLGTSASTPNFLGKAGAEDEAKDAEGCLPAPSFSKSFGDAFALALMKAENTNGNNPAEDEGQGRKKKKNKQKLLFTTSMACNSK